tara:strand:- start:441 stop:1109 length:669 start_codon:yes stop_codon:yes gene_type:complete
MNIKKKIFKNFLVQQLLAFIAFVYIFTVIKTSKIYIKNSFIPESYWNQKKPFILAFWHSQLMMISFSWKFKKKINILASGHSDGRFGAIIGKYFKLKNVPTSNQNKAISLRPIFEILQKNDYIGITPDGPRGPKEIVQDGIIKIAKKNNVPIIPIGFWSSKNFSLKSWDSFLITLPFSKSSFVWGKPLEVPKDTKDEKITIYQELLQKKINKCIQEAKQNCK